MPAPPAPSGAVPSHARAETWPSRAGRRARRPSPPRTSRAGTGSRSPHGRGGESRLSAAINTSWSSRARAAVSGDGAASPSETAAARRARPWRRRVDRARLRASFATILSSQGRKGASGTEPGERVVGLHECLLGRVLRLAAIARDQPGDTEGDLPVPLDADPRTQRRRPLGLAVRARRPPVVGPPRELFPSQLRTPVGPHGGSRSARPLGLRVETYPVEGCPSPFA